MTQKNSLLLKQALAVLYVILGKEKCTAICPERCCQYNTCQLPKNQVERMAVYYTPLSQGSPAKEGGPTNGPTGGAMTLVSKGTAERDLEQERADTVQALYPTDVWQELGKNQSTALWGRAECCERKTRIHTERRRTRNGLGFTNIGFSRRKIGRH